MGFFRKFFNSGSKPQLPERPDEEVYYHDLASRLWRETGTRYNFGSGIAIVRDLRTRAENGDADAQFKLGQIYFDGNGVNKDDAKAEKWLRMAENQGHDKAHAALRAIGGYCQQSQPSTTDTSPSSGKKPVSVDPKNPAVADKIASAYARVLEEVEENQPMIRPISRLPYTKEQIAIALMTDTLSKRSSEYARAAGACYVLLADFRSEEDAAIAAAAKRSCDKVVGLRLSGDDTGLETELAAGHVNDRFVEILENSSEEMSKLSQEWQAFIEKNGLAE